MKKRRLFLISLALAAVAIGLQFVAMGHTSQRVRILARSATLDEAERANARNDAERHARLAHRTAVAGLASAVTGVGFLAVSHRQHEPARRSVAFLLLLFYLMLHLILI
jgi:uncharacterized membrane protein YozB (DUF420 family)